MGAYIADHYGNESVFLCSIFLIGIDLVFIALVLPESLGARAEAWEGGRDRVMSSRTRKARDRDANDNVLAFQVCLCVMMPSEISLLNPLGTRAGFYILNSI